MEPRLVQQQAQKLVLSPQIRQYLKLLQMPLTELQHAVELELAENPMLEEDSTLSKDDTGSAAEEAPLAREKHPKELEMGEYYGSPDSSDDGSGERFGSFGPSLEDPQDLQRRKSYRESLLTKPEALSDFLLWQVRFLDLEEKNQKIAEEIIGNIDDEGYLKAGLGEMAQACQATEAEVLNVLTQIQEFDPPGIAARSLQEALILQLKKKGPQARVALAIVTQHLGLLEKRDWTQLAKILSTDVGEIKKASQIIMHLEPRPGRTFYTEEPIAVQPDAVVSFDEDREGKLKIEILDDTIPGLRLNPYYRKLLRDKKADAKTKTFLREKMLSAMNFLKAIKLRKTTLYDITKEIIKAQPDFFEKGFAHLRPLRLKDIAYHLGVHESTVSRALQGKYISTPQGTIPYKSFFSAKLMNVEGVDESQKSIMEKIRRLVEDEDPAKPLSDQELVKKLRDEGSVVARRTVAKYRESLKILPSHMRRRRL